MNKVAVGKVSKTQMLTQQLAKYLAKFKYFKQHIGLMDQLFEAKFIALKDAGKPFIQCCQCYKFTKLVSQKPQRIYCPTCDRIYQVVQNGKLIEVQGASCALCGQRLISSLVSGKDKHQLFCPKCYTDGHEQ